MTKFYLFKKIYRIFYFAICLVATICTFTDHIAVFGGNGRPVALFFTTWSVWLCFVSSIFCFIFAMKEKDDSQNLVLLKFCADIMIIATFIVAGFVLPEKIWTRDYWTFGGAFKHFLVPVMTVLDSAFFDKKSSYKIFYPFAGVVIPLIYWIVVIARVCIKRHSCGGSLPEALWNSYYPYGFTNFDNGHSLGGLIGLLAGILLGLILIGFLFLALKREKKNPGKK